MHLPGFLIKATSEDDFYVVWSTVSDSPLGWGSRQEVTDMLLEEIQRQAKEQLEEGFAKADVTGTSHGHPLSMSGIGDWGQKELRVDSHPTKDEPVLPDSYIPRELLTAWVLTGNHSLLIQLPDGPEQSKEEKALVSEQLAKGQRPAPRPERVYDVPCSPEDPFGLENPDCQ